MIDIACMVFIVSFFIMLKAQEERNSLLRRLKKHFNPNFCQLNQLIQSYFDSGKGQQYLPKIKEELRKMLEQYKSGNSCTFFCGKAIKSSNNRKVNVYTCQECREQYNSILCEECFDVSRHKGHNYKRVQLSNGSCDCGFKSKWQEEGFCSAHKYTEEKIECFEKRQEFTKRFLYLFEILHLLNSQFSKQNQKLPSDCLIQSVDPLCQIVIQQLNELNKIVKTANRTTSDLLRSKVSIEDLGEIQILDILLSFRKLPKTSSSCVLFLNTLFVLNDSLQQSVAITYQRRQHEFFKNPYRNLIHTLFASSLMISQITEDFVFDYPHSSSYQPVVEETYHLYMYHYLNLTNLNNLQRDCAVIYWTRFFKSKRFNNIGDYCKDFKTQEHHNKLNQFFYDIQLAFIGQMIKTIDVIKNQEFLHQLCFQLFQKITNVSNQKPIQNNLLFTYERLWATCTYAFIVHKNDNFEASFENLLFKALRLHSKQESIHKFTFLLEKILKYMQASNVLPVVHQKRHQKFCATYYCNQGFMDNDGVLLANVDAIFFKIVVRMLQYSEKTILNHKINQYVRIFFDQGKKNFSQFINFVDKLHEYLYSEYADLFLATKFQDFRNQPYYLCKYKGYFHNMLCSLSVEVDLIDSRTFGFLVKCLLFDAPEAFKDFINEISQQSNQKLERTKAQGRKINLVGFLVSLAVKGNQKVLEFFNFSKMGYSKKTHPNENCNEEMFYNLLESEAFLKLKEIFQFLCRKHSNQQNMQAITYQKLSQKGKKQVKQIYSSMQKLVAYPKLANLQTQNIQQYMKILQINFFKNQLKQRNQIQLLQNYIPQVKSESQQSQQQFERLSNEFHQQRDQDLRQRQVPSNHNNIQASIVEKVEQKKEQSVKSSNQLELESESTSKTNQFKAKCSRCNKPIENIVLPCLVSFKRIPNVFDILPDQKCLIFTSCQHFFHQDYQSCVPKTNASGYGSCPKCSKRFNFLLILPDTYKLSQQQRYNKIIKIIDSLIKRAKLPYETQGKKQWYFNAFKSFVWFLLMISMASNPKESDFYAYKALARILQIYFSFSKTYTQNADIISKMFQTKEDSKYKDLIKYLTCIVGETIIPHQEIQFGVARENIFLPLSQKHSKIIDKAMNFCLSYKKPLQITFVSQPQKIRFFELPHNLQLLTQNYIGVCQSCQKKNPKITFVICLHPLHCERKMEEKRCISCIEPFISQHIRIVEEEKRPESYIRHEEEMLTIITDTGEITYYARLNRKVWAFSLGSVYLDDNLNQLTVLQPVSADKIPSRSTFKLKREKYEEIVLNFYMRKYLGSDRLRLFLEQ